MDIATLVGLLIGFISIIGGSLLEGVGIRALTQPTAALIVVGGTIGATCISFPLRAIIQAVKDAKRVFFPPVENLEALILQIVGLAQKARKDGIISLESDTKQIKDAFFRKGMSFVIDGFEHQQLRAAMESELDIFEEHSKVSAEVFEAAGGYAPTVGIIGAVLGLIAVMQNLNDPEKLGGGIAVAFVATIYGLLVANLICLPCGSKIKQQIKFQVVCRTMILDGLCCILNGDPPTFIERKLRGYLVEAKEKG